MRGVASQAGGHEGGEQGRPRGGHGGQRLGRSLEFLSTILYQLSKISINDILLKFLEIEL